MGDTKSKGSSTQVINQTTTPTPTPEETKLNQMEIERLQATQPGMIEAQKSGLNLVSQLLTGKEPLPGFFNELSQGISPTVTNEIVQQSLRDIYPQFQSSGILDSGVAASVASRTAGDIRRATQEYNLGNKFNLLNLALSGQAQVQSPILQQSQILSGRLAGLRSTNTQGTTTSNFVNRNPFLTGSDIMSGVGTGIGIWGALKK